MIPFCCTVFREWCGNGLLEDVLIFFSGSDCVPPTGYGRQPKVLLQHFFGKTLATASTCQLTMILSVAHGNSYNKFKDLILSFKVNDGFGSL